eukprot:gene5359-5576_t
MIGRSQHAIGLRRRHGPEVFRRTTRQLAPVHAPSKTLLHASQASPASSCMPTYAFPDDCPEGRPLDLSLGPLALMEQRFSVAGHTLIVITPRDVDGIFDFHAEHGNEDGDPYWARVWPSAVALAQLVLTQPELVAGKRVVDLGAKEVVLTDREPLALVCALLSAHATLNHQGPSKQQPEQQPAIRIIGPDFNSADILNQISGVYALLNARHTNDDSATGSGSGSGTTGSGSGSGTTSFSSVSSESTPSSSGRQPVCKLEGGDLTRFNQNRVAGVGGGEEYSSHSNTSYSTGSFGTGTRNNSDGRFDVVLACDVLYEDGFAEPIATLMPRLLGPNLGSHLLLADPPNRTAQNPISWKRFRELMAEGGTMPMADSGDLQKGRQLRKLKKVVLTLKENVPSSVLRFLTQVVLTLKENVPSSVLRFLTQVVLTLKENVPSSVLRFLTQVVLTLKEN